MTQKNEPKALQKGIILFWNFLDSAILKFWFFLHFLLVLDSYLIWKGVGGNWSGEILKIQQFLEKVILKTVLFVHYYFSQKRVVQDERDAIFNLYFVNAISKQLWAASKPLVLTDKPKLFLPPTKIKSAFDCPHCNIKYHLNSPKEFVSFTIRQLHGNHQTMMK